MVTNGRPAESLEEAPPLHCLLLLFQGSCSDTSILFISFSLEPSWIRKNKKVGPDPRSRVWGGWMQRDGRRREGWGHTRTSCGSDKVRMSIINQHWSADVLYLKPSSSLMMHHMTCQHESDKTELWASAGRWGGDRNLTTFQLTAAVYLQRCQEASLFRWESHRLTQGLFKASTCSSEPQSKLWQDCCRTDVHTSLSLSVFLFLCVTLVILSFLHQETKGSRELNVQVLQVRWNRDESS